MQRSRWPSVARQLLNEVPDADLLERYVRQQADDAFAQLVTRYSRLVWGQCRNLLPNDADADDAFQATFLTLARSAKSIRAGAPLGPWLHGVAYRVCLNARRASGRRAKREKACARPEADRPVAASTWESAFAAVAEEVQKLPEAQRAAFVLCCIEGRATTEVAASLGQKLGTFSARLTRAKQTLLDRLAKRGIGAGVLALGGVTGSVSVAPAALIVRTLALIPSGVTIPSSVLVLTHGVTGMLMIRFKLLAAGVMVATGLGLSLGGGWYSSALGQFGGPAGLGGAGLPPASKADPNIEKLKADLEKTKTELAWRIELDTAPQYEYERVPEKGLTAKEFEAKLAEREKAGWEFLGQVDLNLGGVPLVGPKLVFRKKPATPPVISHGPMHLDTRDGSFNRGPPGGMWPSGHPATAPAVPKVAKPTEPATIGPPMGVPKVAKPVPLQRPYGGEWTAPYDPETDPVVRHFDKLRIAELEKLVEQLRVIPAPAAPTLPTRDPDFPKTIPPASFVTPVFEGGSQGVPIPFETATAQDKARIAELEKLLAEFQAGKAPVKPSLGRCYYRSEDFGNWELPRLIEVLDKVFADEIKAKKFNAYFRIESERGTFTVNDATPEEIRAVTAWLKKLKK